MNNFPIAYENDLTSEEKILVDRSINDIINSCGSNLEQLTQLVMQASTAINANESRLDALKKQNFFQRLFMNITGKNRKIRGEINRDFVIAHFASIKMIEKLVEQNKLSLDTMLVIDSKINSVTNKLSDVVFKMKYKIADKIKNNELRIEQLEKSVNVIHLAETIEYEKINGVFYRDLDNRIKIVCIVSDFFSVTEGKYNSADLKMLKPIMGKIGLDPNDKMNIISIYKSLMTNTAVYIKFTEKLDKNKLNKLEDFQIPFLYGLKDGNISKDIDFINDYANHNLNTDLSKEYNNFELSALLINQLSYINNYDIEYIASENDNQMNINKKHKNILGKNDDKSSLSYQDKYSKALSLFSDKKYDEAINIFEEILYKSSNKEEIYNMLVESCFYLSRFEKANDIMKQAVVQGYRDFNSDKRAAIALYKMNRYVEAINILKRLEYSTPYDEELLFFMATIYRRMNYYTDSRNCYKKILDLNDNTAIPYVNLSEMAVCGAPDTNKLPQNIWHNHYKCIYSSRPHAVKKGDWKKKALMIDTSLDNLFYSSDKKIYPRLIHIDMIDKYLKEHYR